MFIKNKLPIDSEKLRSQELNECIKVYYQWEKFILPGNTLYNAMLLMEEAYIVRIYRHNAYFVKKKKILLLALFIP
ncbi:MAG: hypothetical protein AAGA64_03540 [Bacteroidota bacterium]